jgi:hypothetical protein
MTNNNESYVSVPAGLCLSRSEAARYVGVSGESAIRAAEAKGLQSARDAAGQVWHTPETLDAWKWRVKPPAAAQKARVLREAYKERRQEARARTLKEEMDERRKQAEWDARQASDTAQFEAETELRARVRRKAREMSAAFEAVHMDERAAGKALGFPSSEARSRLRGLVNRGLLRRVESPLEPRVETSMDGAREVESCWPLCSGGPFFLREEVLALRRKTMEGAGDVLRDAPAEVRAMPEENIVAEILRLLLERPR